MDLLTRLDEALFKLEKTAVWLILELMGIVMFFSVVHRAVSAMDNSRSAPEWVLAAVGEGGWPVLASLLMTGILGFFGVLVLRTRGSDRALVGGLIAGLVLTAAGWLFLWLMPNGIVLAQPISLSLLLWLSLLGASLAAHDRRHLAMDIGSKLWPESLRPKVAAVGHVVSAIFCLGILYLATRSVADHVDKWAGSEGAADVVSGTTIPKWFAAAAVPYGALVLAFRFLLEAVRTWKGEIKEEGDDTLHQLGIRTEEAS